MKKPNPSIKWNVEEVASFLGTKAVPVDDGYSYHFKLQHDDHVLRFAVFPYSQQVIIELFRLNEDRPIVRYSLSTEWMRVERKQVPELQIKESASQISACFTMRLKPLLLEYSSQSR